MRDDFNYATMSGCRGHDLGRVLPDELNGRHDHPSKRGARESRSWMMRRNQSLDVD